MPSFVSPVGEHALTNINELQLKSAAIRPPNSMYCICANSALCVQRSQRSQWLIAGEKANGSSNFGVAELSDSIVQTSVSADDCWSFTGMP
jgi:hypothetical protein